MRTYSPFIRRYRSQAFRTLRYGERRPLVRVLRSIPGFLYFGIGPIALWVDGQRVGIGRR